MVSIKFFFSCIAAYFGGASQITHSDTLSFQGLESIVSKRNHCLCLQKTRPSLDVWVILKSESLGQAFFGKSFE